MLTILKRGSGKDRSIRKIEINSLKDFIDQLNLYYQPVDLYIGVPEKLESEIERLIRNQSEVKYKFFFKTYVKKFMYPRSRTKNTNSYWMNRGYSENDSIKKVKETQFSFSEKFLSKKEKFPEIYVGFNKNQKEYWIKRGFTESEAIEIISENQSTFSLSKCIDKLGEIEGRKRWNQRQEKWKESLSKTRNIKWKTESQSVSYKSYFNRYGKDWLSVLIKQKESNPNVSQERILILKEIESIYYSPEEDLLQYLCGLEFPKFKKIISGSLVNFILDTNYFDLLSYYMEFNSIKKIQNTRYGNSYYYRGKYYKSDGEYSIGEYLESIGVIFFTQMRYEGTKRFTDFYVPSIETYFELTGMRNDEKNYSKKRNLLSKTKYKIIWSDDPEFIKKYIYEKIYKNL